MGFGLGLGSGRNLVEPCLTRDGDIVQPSDQRKVGPIPIIKNLEPPPLIMRRVLRHLRFGTRLRGLDWGLRVFFWLWGHEDSDEAFFAFTGAFVLQCKLLCDLEEENRAVGWWFNGGSGPGRVTVVRVTKTHGMAVFEPPVVRAGFGGKAPDAPTCGDNLNTPHQIQSTALRQASRPRIGRGVAVSWPPWE